MVLEDPADPAGFLDGEDEVFSIIVRAECTAADGSRPDRGDHRADLEAVAGDLVGDCLEVVVGGVGIDVGVEEEHVDAVVLAAVDLGGGGELEHAVERDGRVVGFRFLADKAGPHGVVQFHGGGSEE